MQHKTNIALFSVIFLSVGILTGWLIWGMHDNEMSGMHRMPNGHMMSNNPQDMQGMMMNMNAGLQGKTGDEFDREFLSEMIIHHQGAVDMAKMVLTSSKRPELTILANDIISAQTKEIEMMRKWQQTWFK